jgi:hypothetical protein
MIRVYSKAVAYIKEHAGKQHEDAHTLTFEIESSDPAAT